MICLWCCALFSCIICHMITSVDEWLMSNWWAIRKCAEFLPQLMSIKWEKCVEFLHFHLTIASVTLFQLWSYKHWCHLIDAIVIINKNRLSLWITINYYKFMNNFINFKICTNLVHCLEKCCRLDHLFTRPEVLLVKYVTWYW